MVLRRLHHSGTCGDHRNDPHLPRLAASETVRSVCCRRPAIRDQRRQPQGRLQCRARRATPPARARLVSGAVHVRRSCVLFQRRRDDEHGSFDRQARWRAVLLQLCAPREDELVPECALACRRDKPARRLLQPRLHVVPESEHSADGRTGQPWLSRLLAAARI